MNYALGQGTNYNRDRLDPKWFKPLADAVLYFAAHDKDMDVAQQIMGHYHFTPSDECRRVRKEAAKILHDEFSRTGVSPVEGQDHLFIAAIPLDRISNYINWISANDPAVEPELWKQIAAGMREWWAAEPDWDKKNQIAGILTSVLAGHIGQKEYLEFLRVQLEKGLQEYKAGFAGQLFNALLGQPWSAQYENEAFGLLEQLSDAEEPQQRLVAQIGALYRLTDRMVQARFDARNATIEHQEKLTRIELAAKRTENLKAAREGFADRLREDARKRQPPLSRWMTIERVYLDVLLGRNLEQVGRRVLGDARSGRKRKAESGKRKARSWKQRRDRGDSPRPVSDDAGEPGGPQDRQAGSRRSAAGVSRQGDCRRRRRHPLPAVQGPVAGGPGSAQGSPTDAGDVDQGRRRR